MKKFILNVIKKCVDLQLLSENEGQGLVMSGMLQKVLFKNFLLFCSYITRAT